MLGLALALLVACAAAAPERKFVKETYSFLDMFGSMLSGSHLPVSDVRYGGSKCAGCTILLVVVESLADVHGTSIADEFAKLCTRLPSVLREPCDEFVTVFGPIIVPMLEAKETADAVCLAINFCGGGAPGPVCRLLNPPDDLARERAAVAAARRQLAAREQFRLKRKATRETPWGWLLKRLEYTFNSHLPFDDLDNDTFSDEKEFRGWSWRGKDCNDCDRNVRPGRNSRGQAAGTDWNCNGIYGTDPSSGRPYEETLCEGVQQLRLLLVFRVPFLV